MTDAAGTLAEWLALRDLSLKQIQAKYNMSADDIMSRNARYGGLKKLTELYNEDKHPGRFYFAGDKLALLYVNKPEAFTREMLLEYAGEPALTLRSRAGKQYHHSIYPEKGLAFSSRQKHSEVKLLEIFPPMSIEDYEDRLYVDPGNFEK